MEFADQRFEVFVETDELRRVNIYRYLVLNNYRSMRAIRIDSRCNWYANLNLWGSSGDVESSSWWVYLDILCCRRSQWKRCVGLAGYRPQGRTKLSLSYCDLVGRSVERANAGGGTCASRFACPGHYRGSDAYGVLVPDACPVARLRFVAPRLPAFVGRVALRFFLAMFPPLNRSFCFWLGRELGRL